MWEKAQEITFPVVLSHSYSEKFTASRQVRELFPVRALFYLCLSLVSLRILNANQERSDGLTLYSYWSSLGILSCAISRNLHGSTHRSGSLRLFRGESCYIVTEYIPLRLLSECRLWVVTAFALDPAYHPSSHLELWRGCCWSHCIEGFFDRETPIERIWQVRKEMSFFSSEKSGRAWKAWPTPPRKVNNPLQCGAIAVASSPPAVGETAR